jgi:hypothetical protein
MVSFENYHILKIIPMIFSKIALSLQISFHRHLYEENKTYANKIIIIMLMIMINSVNCSHLSC